MRENHVAIQQLNQTSILTMKCKKGRNGVDKAPHKQVNVLNYIK